MGALSVRDLFGLVRTTMQGPVMWKTPILETGPGIYVIALAEPAAGPVSRLADDMRKRWIRDEAIIYIGRSKHLRRRLKQFYRHVHGQARPHRGGQDILLLKTELMHVYWGATADYVEAERTMIEEFKKTNGALPFANRVRGTK